MMWRKIKWLMSGYSDYKLMLAWLIIGTPIFAALVMAQPLILKYVFDVISKGSGVVPAWLEPLRTLVSGYGLDAYGAGGRDADQSLPQRRW